MKSYKMIGTLLGDGLITIKKEIRDLLSLKKGDIVELVVKKIQNKRY